MKACKKCGLDHENPGGELQGIIVLACALGWKYEFVTREGAVPRPHKDAGLA